jgi:membrane protein
MDRLPTTDDDRTWDEIDSPKQRIKRLGDVIVESIRAVFIDNVPQWAAAISYYTMLSAFPLLLVGASIATFFVEPEQATERLTDLIGDFVPEGEQQIEDVVQSVVDARGQIGLLSFVGLLWTGTRVFGTMVKALNIAYDVDDPYNFFQRLLIEVIMLLTVGMLFLGALTSGFFLDLAWDAVQFLPGNESFFMDLIQGVVGGVLIVGGFFLVYRFMPRADQNWRSAIFGAVIAAALFIIARPLFLYYMGEFGDHNVIYGPLAILIILMIWIWVTAIITLFGGEIGSHFQAMLIEGQNKKEVEQRHRERSPGNKGGSGSSSNRNEEQEE